MRPLNLALTVLANRRGDVPRPSWCTYLVNFLCNARCGMCDSWRMKPGKELTPDEVATVFGKIGPLDVVRLSGGEPFLREDMLDVATAILEQSNPSVIHFTTNGSYPERAVDLVKRFRENRRLRFMVSFDGLEEEHDANRVGDPNAKRPGRHVTFESAVDCVRRLAALRQTHGIEVSANHTVISKQSLEDNAGLKELLGGKYGIDVHSVLAYAESSMYGVKLHGKRADHMIVPTGYPLHPKLHGADVTGFVDREIAELEHMDNAMLRFGKQYYLRGLKARLAGEENPQPNPRCVELRSHIRLLPDGSVPVCQFNTEKVGNLLTQSWEEVWFNEDTKASRQWVDDCPGCWAECEVMPNAIFTGDIVRG